MCKISLCFCRKEAKITLSLCWMFQIHMNKPQHQMYRCTLHHHPPHPDLRVGFTVNFCSRSQLPWRYLVKFAVRWSGRLRTIYGASVVVVGIVGVAETPGGELWLKGKLCYRTGCKRGFRTEVKSQIQVWSVWWDWWQHSGSLFHNSCLETESWGPGVCSALESGKLCVTALMMAPRRAWRQGWIWPRPAPPGWTCPSSWFYGRRQTACWNHLTSG